MRLLVSVTSRREALEAIEGGAHIIDVKNPLEGSLGANFPRVIKQVREATPSGIEVSATLGDLPNLPGTGSLAALGAVVSGANYVKAGLFGVRSSSEAIHLTREICRAVKEYDNASRVIIAGYADFNEIGCLNPLNLPRVAQRVGADGVMIDVKNKNNGGLFDLLSDGELRKFVEVAHEYDLTVALAGSLDRDDLERLYGIGADIIGVRKAVCSGKNRLKGVVQRGRVREFIRAMKMSERQLSNDSRTEGILLS